MTEEYVFRYMIKLAIGKLDRISRVRLLKRMAQFRLELKELKGGGEMNGKL